MVSTVTNCMVCFEKRQKPSVIKCEHCVFEMCIGCAFKYNRITCPHCAKDTTASVLWDMYFLNNILEEDIEDFCETNQRYVLNHMKIRYTNFIPLIFERSVDYVEKLLQNGVVFDANIMNIASYACRFQLCDVLADYGYTYNIYDIMYDIFDLFIMNDYKVYSDDILMYFVESWTDFAEIYGYLPQRQKEDMELLVKCLEMQQQDGCASGDSSHVIATINKILHNL